MRILLDACLLVPPVLREILIETAAAGAFVPLWSPRILDEWAHAAERLSGGGAQARIEAALLNDRFRGALILAPLADIPPLRDPGDTHVLAAAISGGAARIMTRNIRDFPLRRLAEYGIDRSDPDEFLCSLAPDIITPIVLHAKGPSPEPLRGFLKRAGLPRLGKRLGQSV